MNDKRTFAVYTIGIADNEKKVLKNIFKLSLYRTRSYTLHEALINGPAEILLVDPQGHDTATSDWTEFRSRYPQVPTVVVKADDTEDTQNYSIKRPFVASRVLALLDQVSIKEHRFAPEIVIGANAEPDQNTDTEVVNQTLSQPQNGAAVKEQSPESSHIALVIDDSLPVRKQIELELRLLGVSADFAESGEQAFELLDKKPYDIVFLDVMLPGVDGYRVCKTIKKNGSIKQTPVVMLTGKSSTFDRVRGTFAGCDTYLTKPVAHDSFQKVVRKYLG